MPNPLDFVTEDQRDGELSPFEQAKMRGISIHPYDQSNVASNGNALVQTVAPEPAPFDLMKGLEQLRALVANYGAGVLDQVGVAGVEPGLRQDQLRRGRDRLLGTGGEERYVTWPEKMVRSGTTLPGDVMSGAEPMADPATGRTSERVIERAQDIAGMVGGSALTQRGGSATLGSGPVRPAMRTGSSKLFAKETPEGWFAHQGEGPGKFGPFKTKAEVDTYIAANGGAGPSVPVFYSALEHAATNAAQDVMSPQQWLGYLKNQPGVKAEELAWTGIGDWLGKHDKDFRMHKEEVQRYLDEHKIEIKDVTKGDGKNGPHDEHGDQIGESDPGGTKYSSYQLPGGENYREHLLTMPERPRAGVSFEDWVRKVYGRNASEYPPQIQGDLRAQYRAGVPDKNSLNVDTSNYRSSHWDEPNVLAHVRTNDRIMDATAIADIEAKVVKAYPDTKLEYMGSGMVPRAVNEGVLTPQEAADWSRARGFVTGYRKGEGFEGQPGTGKKSLHIEEIQSDWHQQGRKQGYKSDVTREQRIKESDEKVADLEKQYEAANKEYIKEGGADRLSKLSDLMQEIKDERQHGNVLVAAKTQGIPDAPFKTSWPELALKRMIRHAAENGYDRISWTPGEAQAARYDLSRSIKNLQFQKNRDGTYNVWGEATAGGNHRFGQDIPVDKLADYVGKDVAERIVNPKLEVRELSGKAATDSKAKFEVVDENGRVKSLAETKEQAEKQVGLFKETGSLKGTDLKVGGEGMREFYDKMLPKMAEKIGKAHGVKVKMTEPVNSKEQLSKNILSHPDLSTILDEMQYNHPTRAGWPEEKAHKFLKDMARNDPEKFVKQYEKTTGNYDDPHLEFSSFEVPALHYFDIPQSLRDHAIGKGFPLYMSGIPFPLTPVDHDPFKKKDK